MTEMIHTFQALLAQPAPLSQIRQEMVELRLNGVSKDDVYAALEHLCQQASPEQDAILLDAMDILVGFCRPPLHIE